MQSGYPAGGLAPNSLPVAHTLDFLDPESDDSDVVWYGTVVKGLSSVAPNGQSTLQIDKAVDFYWIATTVHADVVGAAQTESSIVVPLVNIEVTDGSSQKDLVNMDLPISSFGSLGERPNRLVNPRRIRAQTVLVFTYTAIVAAGTTYTNLYVVLHGFTLPPS